MEDSLVFRELNDPAELVGMLRARHEIYFQQQRYGATKPLGIDLTAYDQRSRLFGLFRAGVLIGGLRLVFRHDQPIAPLVRAMRAVVADVVAEQTSDALPSEDAFDLVGVLGPRRELVDVEVGRLFMCHAHVGAGVVRKLMVCTLAAIVALRARLFFYSCSTALARRYAAVTKPRWTFEADEHAGIHADGFVFPARSCAAVASPEDSPFFVQALALASELSRTGAISLTLLVE